MSGTDFVVHNVGHWIFQWHLQSIYQYIYHIPRSLYYIISHIMSYIVPYYIIYNGISYHRIKILWNYFLQHKTLTYNLVWSTCVRIETLHGGRRLKSNLWETIVNIWREFNYDICVPNVIYVSFMELFFIF